MLSGEKFKVFSEFKYLGLIIEFQLSFKSHACCFVSLRGQIKTGQQEARPEGTVYYPLEKVPLAIQHSQLQRHRNGIQYQFI